VQHLACNFQASISCSGKPRCRHPTANCSPVWWSGLIAAVLESLMDDSLTVREAERQLLANHGYDVEVAGDGMDGWNAVRVGHYDLVITDVDMPRMTGFELVSQIKNDSHLHALPVMIVSYKGSEDDRNRGLEAGANYYFTKSSFHDETLLQAVIDLIDGA
jgi:two-component system, chemotaxis family, sensor histidine kinase and response regulator WspE